MSTLILVRHAQASFFGEDYDQLSELGRRQAKLLGEYWARRGERFDAIYTGPRRRQMHTAQIVGDAFKKAGLPWSEPVLMEELDEHASDVLLKRCVEKLSRIYPHIRDLRRSYHAADGGRQKMTSFQRLFEAVMALWLQGKVRAEGVESWRDFRNRVSRGIDRMMTGGEGGRRIVAFTSVGPTAVSVQYALRLQDLTAFELGWRVLNCAYTSYVFHHKKFTMDAFNARPHLDESSLRTFR